MKLLQKNTRYLLMALPLILLACTLLFFLLLRRQTLHLQNEQLLLKEEDVLQKFQSGTLQGNQNITWEFDLHEVRYPQANIDEPADTSIYYPERKQLVSFQMLRKTVSHTGRKYQLTVFVSSYEIAHLKIAVLSGQALIYIILLYAIVLINRRLSNTLWQPFYRTMDTLEKYDINTQQKPQLEKETGITEFNELNKVINQLSDRNNQAYINQKQFVENASHEIQTPLAIIRSKIELLMEHEELSAKSAGLIMDIADANNRLSTLNQTLILLSKIQNNQFIARAEVKLAALIVKNIENLRLLYLENMPSYVLDLDKQVVLKANPELLDILCNNLLTNAIVHNIPSGSISIQLTADQLIIENSGPPLSIDPQLLFERFRTGDVKIKKTTGLGLAIVKQICELHGYQASYSFQDGKHCINISFSKNTKPSAL